MINTIKGVTVNETIEQLGQRVAREIQRYIAENYTVSKVVRLSFIAHSLGGLITRAALTQPELEPYLPYLHTFVTLSTPHLGMMYHSSLVDGALWLWQRISKSPSITELRLYDAIDKRQSYLYKLSIGPGLRYFRNILLVSSSQDPYVPYHSARMEITPFAVCDPVDGNIYVEMVSNLYHQTQNCNVRRIDVHFGETDKKTFADWTGRSIHTSFIDNSTFIQMFLFLYWDCFY